MSDRIPFGMAPSLTPSSPTPSPICPDWLQIRGDALSTSLLMDFIAVSLHSFLLFSAKCVFFLFSLFFLFSSRSPCSQTEMTSCRGEGVRTHQARQENQGPTAGGVSAQHMGEMLSREGGKTRSEKVIPGRYGASVSSRAAPRGLKCGKGPLTVF